MSESNSTSQNAGQNGEDQGQQKASFDMPEEATQTALHKDDRQTVVDLRTGQEVPEPVAKSTDSENLVLVCLDPTKKQDRYEAAVRVAKRVLKSGDRVIFMTVLPLQVVGSAGLAAFGTPYDMQYQLDTLHKMRKKAVADLANLAKEFPDDIQAYARVVHGGAERQILHTAMESKCSLIILGKRKKMGVWQKLTAPSVSNWVVSKAPCDVLIAK